MDRYFQVQQHISCANDIYVIATIPCKVSIHQMLYIYVVQCSIDAISNKRKNAQQSSLRARRTPTKIK